MDGTVNKKCVLVITDSTETAENAENVCQRKNGHLLALHHESELHDIMKVLQDSSHDKRFEILKNLKHENLLRFKMK